MNIASTVPSAKVIFILPEMVYFDTDISNAVNNIMYIFHVMVDIINSELGQQKNTHKTHLKNPTPHLLMCF